MPVPVRLDFVPPAQTDISELRIYESATKDGSYSQIEAVIVIGEYPDYISTYTTTNATAVDYWFAIDWFDALGGHLGLSDPIQGNTQLLLAEIVGRVMIRDPSINENIIYDEAEAVLESYLPTGTDLQDALVSSVTAQVRSGLTMLTLARCYMFDINEGEEEYTVGLVSQRKKNSRSLKLINELLRKAETALGLSHSAILQMTEIEVAGGVTFATEDKSRLLIELL
jgi:hypothetical protein